MEHFDPSPGRIRWPSDCYAESSASASRLISWARRSAPQTRLPEPPLVQLDHELILQFGRIKAVSMIAPSFVRLLTVFVESDEMPDVVG
jgi:hypothetical protein